MRGFLATSASRGSVICLANEKPKGQGCKHPHTPAPRRSHRSARSPACCSRPLVSTLPALGALLLQLWPVFLSSARVGVPQSAAAFAPSHRGREQAPDEGAHPEVGSKPNLSSRGSETKRHRNSWTAVQLMDHIPVICFLTTAPVEHLNRGAFLQKTLV